MNVTETISINLDSIAKHYSNDEDARKFLEKIRWPNGVACPYCKVTNVAYSLKARETSRKPVRDGVYKCKFCQKQFTVTVGTIFEGSHIPLHKWLMAFNLMCSSRKGISSHQLHRMLGITYKSAWFMAHRIRHAMSISPSESQLSGVIEADETYIGGKHKGMHGRSDDKTPVVALVQRGGGVRSFKVEHVTGKNLRQLMQKNIDRDSTIMTDDFKSYRRTKKHFAEHKVIRHSDGQYVNGDIHTNSVEGYFSILKRGITGIYHHVSKHHLPLYLNEFNFRYCNRHLDNGLQSILAIDGGKHKRLVLKAQSA